LEPIPDHEYIHHAPNEPVEHVDVSDLHAGEIDYYSFV
jgi:hypothetical protein